MNSLVHKYAPSHHPHLSAACVGFFYSHVPYPFMLSRTSGICVLRYILVPLSQYTLVGEVASTSHKILITPSYGLVIRGRLILLAPHGCECFSACASLLARYLTSLVLLYPWC